MENVIVKFKLDGPIFQSGIPLLETITALQEFHLIVDKAYSARFNIPRLTRVERKKYHIIAQDFHKGSFEADLLFAIASAAQSLFPNIQEFGAKELWDIVKSAYTFLKVVATSRSGGKEPIVNITGDNNTVVLVKDNVIQVNRAVYNAADLSEQHYKRLTSFIGEDKITSIASTDSHGEGFVLTEKERRLFNPRTDLEKDVITIQCNIFRFDKEANAGKLRVPDGQPMPAGEYNFKPISKHDNKSFIMFMMNPVVTLNVLKEIETHASGVKRISSLYVVSFENLRQDSLFAV